MFDVNSAFDNAEMPSESHTYIGPGTHLTALAEFKDISGPNEPDKFAASFLVLESNFHEVGTLISTVFDVYSTNFKGAGQKEAGRMLDLIMKLCGYTDRGQASTSFDGLTGPLQKGRGIQIKITGNRGKAPVDAQGNPKIDDRGNPREGWVHTNFYNVAGQDRDSVGATRAVIEALPKFAEAANQYTSQAPAAAPVATPEVAPQIIGGVNINDLLG